MHRFQAEAVVPSPRWPPCCLTFVEPYQQIILELVIDLVVMKWFCIRFVVACLLYNMNIMIIFRYFFTLVIARCTTRSKLGSASSRFCYTHVFHLSITMSKGIVCIFFSVIFIIWLVFFFILTAMILVLVCKHDLGLQIPDENLASWMMIVV